MPPRWGEAEEARGWIQEPKATSCGKLELGREIGGSGSEHGFRLEVAFDLDQVKWVSGTACHNRSYASFNETLKTLETLADWVLGFF